MSEFSLDGIHRGAESSFLVWGEVLGFRLCVDIEENDGLVLGKVEVDHPSSFTATPALKGHSDLSKAAQAWDYIAFVWILQQIVL